MELGQLRAWHRTELGPCLPTLSLALEDAHRHLGGIGSVWGRWAQSRPWRLERAWPVLLRQGPQQGLPAPILGREVPASLPIVSVALVHAPSDARSTWAWAELGSGVHVGGQNPVPGAFTTASQGLL